MNAAFLSSPPDRGVEHQLEEQLRALPPGGELRLPAGRFILPRALTLYQGVRLRGSGPHLTQLVCADKKCVLKLTGNEPFFLSDLALVHEGDQPARVLWAEGVEVTLERCTLSGGHWIDDRGWGCGLHLAGEARGRVAFCEFFENDVGVLVDHEARPILESNRCYQNRGEGIRFAAYSRGRAVQNECTQNGVAGISVRDEAQPELSGNRCHANYGHGLAYAEKAGGLASANDCDYNEHHGITLSGKACPTLVGNQCNENKLCGLDFAGETEVVARDNRCSANRWHGLQVGEKARPFLHRNQARDNLASGLVYFGESAGQARANECGTNDSHGIQVGDSASPLLDANRCRGNRLSGLAYYGKAGGLARQNVCEHNEYHGFQVGEEARPVLEHNRAGHNQLAGVACLGTAQPAVRQNECRENGQTGIVVSDHAEPYLDANLCQENHKIGLAYTGSGAGIAQGNRCESNGQYGLHLGPQAAPILHRNLCSGNPAADQVCLTEAAVSVQSSQARTRVSTGFALTLEGMTLNLSFEPKPAERKVMEALARYGKMSEAQLAKVAGTRRVSGLMESLIEKLSQGGADVVYREGDGPEGAVYAIKKGPGT